MQPTPVSLLFATATPLPLAKKSATAAAVAFAAAVLLFAFGLSPLNPHAEGPSLSTFASSTNSELLIMKPMPLLSYTSSQMLRCFDQSFARHRREQYDSPHQQVDSHSFTQPSVSHCPITIDFPLLPTGALYVFAPVI
jgi:hypothetical protein